MDVSKNKGTSGENKGKPCEQMDDLGVPLFSETFISQKLTSSIYLPEFKGNLYTSSARIGLN